MRFFSKLTLICNVCFIAAVILAYIESKQKKAGHFDGALQLRPWESTVVVLGYGAIIINLVFNFIVLLLLLMKKQPLVPKWIIWFNFLLLLAQFYYFDIFFIS